MGPKPIRFTTNSTQGPRPLTGVGFQPSFIELIATGKTSSAESGVRFSLGNAGSGAQTCHSADGASTLQVYTDRVINLPTPAGLIRASFVSFDADGFTLDFITTVSGYRVSGKAFA